MKLADIDEIAKALAPMFKAVLQNALGEQKKLLESEFLSRIDDLKNELAKNIPVLPDLSALATKEYVGVTLEKSLSAEQVREIVRVEASDFQKQVLNAVGAIPVPKDGASVTVDDVAPMLQKMVDTALSVIPAPKDGRSVHIEDVLPEIKAEISRQIAEIPRPADGKSISIDDVRPQIEAEVQRQMAELPTPKDGASITADDVSPMIQQMVNAAAAAIPVPQDGKSVTVEDVLPEIKAEIARLAAQIPGPVHGKDGRDAVDVMILPAIDFAKSYPRGTYATHNGGLWKSHSQTAGERGWDCIIRGVGEIHLEQRNERNFVVVYTDTVGDKKEFPISVPSLIYRGIFREGKEYQRGDTVTWGGSLWHCNAELATAKPGESEEQWKLAVKRSGR